MFPTEENINYPYCLPDSRLYRACSGSGHFRSPRNIRNELCCGSLHLQDLCSFAHQGKGHDCTDWVGGWGRSSVHISMMV